MPLDNYPNLTSMSEKPRFELLDPHELEELLFSRRSESTNRAIKAGGDVFLQFLSAKGLFMHHFLDNNDSLDNAVKEFFLTVKRKDGERYKSKSLHGLKYGIKQFLIKELGKDIGDDKSFPLTAESFKVAMHMAKKDGKGAIEHKQPITTGDQEKIKSYLQDCSTPVKLQHKVFMDIMLHFCRRGRENLREIRVDWFKFNQDENDVEYVTMRDELDKNHRGEDNSGQQARMYATGMNDCPVKHLKLYISKLNKSSPCFFQRPRMAPNLYWYDAVPIGKNTVGTMMQRISKETGLSKIYTNHCIRATVITSLDHAGIESRHIQQISGHKSISSLQHYAQMVSNEQLRKISNTISLVGNSSSTATSVETQNGGQTYNSCTFNFNLTH